MASTRPCCPKCGNILFHDPPSVLGPERVYCKSCAWQKIRPADSTPMREEEAPQPKPAAAKRPYRKRVTISQDKGIKMWITCECGHTDDFDKFTKTPIFGDLPKGFYQCPSCKQAWVRKEEGYRVITSGSASMVIPERVSVVRVDARM